MTRVIIATLAVLACLPASAVEDVVTEAPARSYSIVQHYVDRWNAVIHFRHALRPAAWLTRDAEGHRWPAVYQISPDDRWVLRIQKTGLDENLAWLYRVEPSGRVSRMEERLDDLVGAHLVVRERLFSDEFHQQMVEFVGWDLPRNILEFRFTAVPRDAKRPRLDRRLTYHLDSHELTE